MIVQNIPCKLIEKRGKKTEIELEGQRIMLSSDYLPSDAVLGETFYLCFSSAKEATIKEENLAKLILEEILNGK
jgi:hypothetical protein